MHLEQVVAWWLLDALGQVLLMRSGHSPKRLSGQWQCNNSDLYAAVKYQFWLLVSYHKLSLVSRLSYYYTPYIPSLNDSWEFLQFLPITSHILKETPSDLLYIHVLLVLLSLSWILLIIKSELLSWPYMRARKCTINACQYTVYSSIAATSNLGWCIALSTLQKLYSNRVNVIKVDETKYNKRLDDCFNCHKCRMYFAWNNT